MGETRAVRLRSPWVLAWWAMAAFWFALGWVMLPVRLSGTWINVDGSPADPFGVAIGVLCLAFGVVWWIFAPAMVRVGGGLVRYRWGFKCERIDLREVTDVDVIPRPGTVFDGVQPVIRCGDREQPLTGLAGYPGTGGRNRRVDRQVEVLRRACQEAQSAADVGEAVEPD